MRKSLVALATLALSATAWAGDSDSHTVTVTVEAINEVAIVGGDVSITIDSGTVSGPASESDSTTADLEWSTNEEDRKITVQTDLASPQFSLTVEALNVTGGTAVGPVSLSTTPADFVTGISTTNGRADLSYVASATAAAGVGSDEHTVTFTITGD